MEDKDEELVTLKLSIMSAPQPQGTRQPPPSSSMWCFLNTHQHFRQFLPPPPPPEPPVISLSLRHLPYPGSNPYPSANLSPAPRRERVGPPLRSRTRRSPSKILVLLKGKSLNIPPPYPWATAERAKVRSIGDLLSSGTRMITGDVKCKRCDRQYKIQYNVEEKFYEVDTFFAINHENMHNRAPPIWMNPTLPSCMFCKESNCVKPVLNKKRSINWLFMFLGQMIGCCKLTQLKYFCKHNDNHSTGAKDRVVYFTYKTLYEKLGK